MTQAPEMPDSVFISADGDLYSHVREAPPDTVKYTRADLTPRWRPIGEYDEGDNDLAAFARQNEFGQWELCESDQATHFMQLAPPEE